LLAGGAALAGPPYEMQHLITDDWDPLGDPNMGGKPYRSCWIESGIGPAQKAVVHWTRKSDGKTDKTGQMDFEAAKEWMKANCD